VTPVKQLYRHDPDNGVFGDCFRAAIASVLDLRCEDVPHFMDKKPNRGESAGDAHLLCETWLRQRGLTQINIVYPGAADLGDLLTSIKNTNYPGLYFLLAGRSRNDVNHNVVCVNGEIAWDPSIDNSGIVGPCDDGHYWVTFFGSTAASASAPNVSEER
jgi:hypothetical protein